MTFSLEAAFGTGRPVVGMVHLAPLPGSPRFESRAAVRSRARGDARALVEGGVDGLLVENYGDFPAHPEDVPKHTVAEMAAVVEGVLDPFDCGVGVNVLRNDPAAALSVAAAVDADFVRVNVHDGVAVTDQGILEGRAHETLRLRDRIDARDVAILADAAVKHADSLRDRDLPTEIEDLVHRGLADGIVVSGPGTGRETPVERIREADDAIGDLDADPPLFVGSGVTSDSVADALEVADGAIVGTSTKENGVTAAPVDPERVRALVEAADEVR
jgi:membrane complex biogenesis BtpA family protein